VLRLSELSPDINGSQDLIELEVLAAGTLAGITIEEGIEDVVVLATLPSLVVAEDDFVVVHLDPPAAITNETTSKTQCTANACYDAAWDVRGGGTGIFHANRVITVMEGNEYQDAVPFTTNGTGTNFLTDLETIQDAGLWFPATCGGDDCTYTTTDPTAFEVSVDWTDVETTATGDSVQLTGTNPNQTGGWEVAGETFGEAN
jgi:hypothetical protein